MFKIHSGGGVNVSRINIIGYDGERAGYINAPLKYNTDKGDFPGPIEFVADSRINTREENTGTAANEGFRFVTKKSDLTDVRLILDPEDLYYRVNNKYGKKNLLHIPTDEESKVTLMHPFGVSQVELTQNNTEIKASQLIFLNSRRVSLGEFYLNNCVPSSPGKDDEYDTSKSGIMLDRDNLHINATNIVFHNKRASKGNYIRFDHPEVHFRRSITIDKCIYSRNSGFDHQISFEEYNENNKYRRNRLRLYPDYIHLGSGWLEAKNQIYSNRNDFILIGNQGQIGLASKTFNTVIQDNGEYHIRYGEDVDITKEYINDEGGHRIGWNSYRFLIDKYNVTLKTSPNTQISIQEDKNRINMVANDFRFVFKELNNEGTDYKENGTDNVALLSKIVKDIETLKAFHCLNDKVIPPEGDVQIFLDPECTRYATGTVHEIYARINKPIGYGEWWSVGNPVIADYKCCALLAPDDEHPDDPYCVNVWVDFISDNYDKPFETGQVIKIKVQSPYDPYVDVTGYKTIFYRNQQ